MPSRYWTASGRSRRVEVEELDAEEGEGEARRWAERVAMIIPHVIIRAAICCQFMEGVQADDLTASKTTFDNQVADDHGNAETCCELDRRMLQAHPHFGR